MGPDGWVNQSRQTSARATGIKQCPTVYLLNIPPADFNIGSYLNDVDIHYAESYSYFELWLRGMDAEKYKPVRLMVGSLSIANSNTTLICRPRSYLLKLDPLYKRKSSFLSVMLKDSFKDQVSYASENFPSFTNLKVCTELFLTINRSCLYSFNYNIRLRYPIIIWCRLFVVAITFISVQRFVWCVFD